MISREPRVANRRRRCVGSGSSRRFDRGAARGSRTRRLEPRRSGSGAAVGAGTDRSLVGPAERAGDRRRLDGRRDRRRTTRGCDRRTRRARGCCPFCARARRRFAAGRRSALVAHTGRGLPGRLGGDLALTRSGRLLVLTRRCSARSRRATVGFDTQNRDPNEFSVGTPGWVSGSDTDTARSS